MNLIFYKAGAHTNWWINKIQKHKNKGESKNGLTNWTAGSSIGLMSNWSRISGYLSESMRENEQGQKEKKPTKMDYLKFI